MLGRFIFALALAIGLTACPEARRAETPDVIVLHTGRMRGNVYPNGMKAPLQHYPFIAGYVKAVRAEAAKTGAKVILLDLGDSLDGSFAAHATGSLNMAAFFNALGYDAIALGNLDSAVPPETLRSLRAKILTPFADSQSNPVPPSAAFTARTDTPGLPVAVMANFYGDVSPAKFPGRFPSTFAGTTGIHPVREYMPGGSAGPGGLTLLTWMKLEDPASPPARFLEVLRAAGVQAIAAHRVYGADEREVWESSGFAAWNPPVSINILRNNGGFVLARLDLKRDGNGWRAIDQQLIPMTANSAPADPAIENEIARFAPAIAEKDVRILTLDQPMGADAIVRTCLAALASVPDSRAALYSRDAVRADWPSGELRSSAVFNALPWTSPVVRFTLARADLERAAASLGLVAAIAEGSPDPLTVSTPAYFADQIAGKFPSGPPVVVAPSEFDWFTARLRADPGLTGGLPSGWSLIEPGGSGEPGAAK